MHSYVQHLRKALTATLFSASFLVPCLNSAHAQPNDSRTIRLVVPFSPGSQTDIVARLVAKPLSDKLGQSIVVENRPGAGGIVAAQSVLGSPADGSSLMLVSSAWSVLPVTGRTLSFEPQKDFEVLGMVARSPNVLIVSKEMGTDTFPDFVASAKQNPDEMNFGSSGIASGTHLNAEYFLSSTGLQATHVPMRGGPETLTELIGGRIQFAFLPPSGVLSGDTSRFSMLGVTGKQRVKALPEIPTLIEAGIQDFEYYLWYALLAKDGTSEAASERLSNALQEVLRDPEVVSALEAQHIEAISLDRTAATEYIDNEISKNEKLVQERDLKLSN